MVAGVREREFDIPEFGNAQNVGEKLFRETDAAGADDSDFETHGPNLDAINMPALEDERKIAPRLAGGTKKGQKSSLSSSPLPLGAGGVLSLGADYAQIWRGRQRRIMLSWVILCCRI
jgi:hypothetical protein